MSDSMPKWAYLLLGTLMVILIIVALISLVTSGGLLSKFTSIAVICVSVLVLFFGHKQYKKDHTLLGQATGTIQKGFREVGSFFGLKQEKNFWEGGRHRKR